MLVGVDVGGTYPPPGAAGGQAGACGRNLLDARELGARTVGTLAAGERLRFEKPGGGGYGEAPSSTA